MCAGLIWLRIGASGGILWIRQWTYVFHKYWDFLAEQLLAYQEGLSWMVRVIYIFWPNDSFVKCYKKPIILGTGIIALEIWKQMSLTIFIPCAFNLIGWRSCSEEKSRRKPECRHCIKEEAVWFCGSNNQERPYSDSCKMVYFLTEHH
jgi:hypothetical protein